MTKTVGMKFFSPERANALIPKLVPLVEELLAARTELAIKLLESRSAVTGPEARGNRLAHPGSPFPAPRYGELKGEIVRLIHRIEATGVIVKDIDLGLIDFPAIREDREIYLCWKIGESVVAYWHPVDEGFAARRALEEPNPGTET